MVTDLSSGSGVFINGVRLASSTLLSVGDTVAFGTIEFRVSAEPASADDLEDGDRTTVLHMDPPPSASRPIPRTMSVGELDMLSVLIDKCIATNRTDDIAPVVADRLTSIAEACESGRTVADAAVLVASRCAIKLAGLTGTGFWINAVVRIYRAQSEPMPMELVDSLYGVLRRARGVEWTPFAEYVDQLHLQVDQMTPTERFATGRIEGLLRAGRG